MPFKNPHPLYTVWRSMIARCNDRNGKQWKDYGGRGISVCERWRHSFANFLSDMGPRPEGHEIDRIDNDGNYEPGNCRWATRSEQMRNQRVTRRVEIGGVIYLASDLARVSGLKTDTIVERARLGLSLEEITDPGRRIFTDGLKRGGLASGAVKRARTHCFKGHEYTAENTYYTEQGWRSCRRCHADRQNKRRKTA